MTKLSITVINAVASAFVFYVFFEGHKAINARALAEVFILYSLSLFCLALISMTYPALRDCWTLNGCGSRPKRMVRAMVGEHEFSVSYHHLASSLCWRFHFITQIRKGKGG